MEEHCLTTTQALGSIFAPALKRSIESEFHKIDSNLKTPIPTVGKGKAIRNRPGGQGAMTNSRTAIETMNLRSETGTQMRT